MRKSENFDLNLYEGTDIFNPLTTDVPNYEKIDAQMEKNYNLSVGKATELKTGTVHALTRENADCPMIHFTATSNFTSNDTFTVDGVQVSALLVDGSTLPTNCYIIGSEVICYLKGTLLTFFLSGSISKDSEKLGGELPSYYSKQEDFDQLETTVGSMGGIVEKNSNDIVGLNKSLGRVLVRSSYSTPQDISLPDSDYDYIECYFRIIGGSTQVLSPINIEKGEIGACFLCAVDSNTSSINSYERRVKLSLDGLTLTLKDCTKNYYRGSYGSVIDNNFITLERVVAHKYTK